MRRIALKHLTENKYSSHSAMSIKEILEELPKLTPEERQYVREWLAAEEFPELKR